MVQVWCKNRGEYYAVLKRDEVDQLCTDIKAYLRHIFDGKKQAIKDCV